MKFEYFVVNENSLDKFNIGHFWIKIKFRVENFSSFTTREIFRSYNSTLAQARALMLGRYVFLGFFRVITLE